MVSVTTDTNGRSILRIDDVKTTEIWNLTISSSDIPAEFSQNNGDSLRAEVIDDVINKAPQSSHAIFVPVDLVAIVQRDGDTRYTYVNKFESRASDPVQFSGNFTIIKQGNNPDVAYDINHLYLRIEFVLSNSKQDTATSGDVGGLDLSGSLSNNDGRQINVDHTQNADQTITA